jgi:tyrosyl-tRNA synthetase
VGWFGFKLSKNALATGSALSLGPGCAVESGCGSNRATEDVEAVDVDVAEPSIGLPRLVAAAGLASSSSEAARKIQQGGVKLDRERVTDIKTRLEVSRGEVLVEAGRRAVRVRLRRSGPPSES